jgi:hypothetical protein
MRWSVAAVLAISVAFGSVSAAVAAPSAQLHAQFDPNRPGAPTTIQFGVSISDAARQVPPPLTEIDLFLPAGLGLASSTLGLAECDPRRLLVLGASGCPANSRVGHGTALGLIESEGLVVNEFAEVTALVGAPVNEQEQVLFYVEAKAPVAAQLVFSGRLLPSTTARFGGSLITPIPLVPAWPEGPDVAVTRFSSSIGPAGLTYFHHRRGQLVPFRPRGISVPTKCPRGGFPFSATLHFVDGWQVITKTSVRCPKGLSSEGVRQRPQ